MVEPTKLAIQSLWTTPTSRLLSQVPCSNGPETGCFDRLRVIEEPFASGDYVCFLPSMITSPAPLCARVFVWRGPEEKPVGEVDLRESERARGGRRTGDSSGPASVVVDSCEVAE